MNAQCEICGKPQSPYPNWIISKGHQYHVGCLADAFDELRQAHAKLAHKLHVSGLYGPWSDDWKGSFEQKHWGDELYDHGAIQEENR
jgi:hypothetical protein